MKREISSTKFKVCAKNHCWYQQSISNGKCVECGSDIFLLAQIPVLSKKEKNEWLIIEKLLEDDNFIGEIV